MVSYQAGDRSAVAVLVSRLSPQLMRLFIAHRSSRLDAEDLVQETWLRIHKARHTYRPGELVLPWLYAIARHVRVDHYRKTQRMLAARHRFDDDRLTTTQSPSADFQVEEYESLLSGLPASQREVLEMLKIAGMSLEEVARATSCTVGSVKQKMHRAYKRLRATIRSMNSDSGRRILG